MTSPAPQSEPDQDGIKSGPNFDLIRLIEEMIGLRARKGLVYDQVRDCPRLVEVAAIWKKDQATEIAKLDDVRAAIRMVKEALEEERPIEGRDSLKVAYGLIVDGPSRDERVRRYLELPKGYRVAHSGPSIERYSKSMAEQLAAKLASIVASQSLFNEANIGNASTVAEHPSHPYAMDVVRARYRMRSDRFVKDIYFERKITCVIPGRHTYLARNTHYSDPRQGVHRTEPDFGCELIRDYHENGVNCSILQLSKSLSAGESFEFTYRIHVNSANPSGHFISMTPAADMSRCEYSVEFAEDAVPTAVWIFRELNYLSGLDQESRRRVACPHDGSRYIFQTFQDLRRGFSYGIDWDW